MEKECRAGEEAETGTRDRCLVFWQQVLREMWCADLLSYSACLLQGHHLPGDKINGRECVYTGAFYDDRFGDEWAIWKASWFSFLLPLKATVGLFFALFDLKIIPNSCYVYGYIMQFDNNVCWMR